MPKNKKNSGYVLLGSVLLSLFLAILLGAAMSRSQSHLKEVNQRVALHRAFYSAESGIDRAIFELRQNAAWQPGAGGEPPVENVPLVEQGKTIGYYSVDVTAGEVFNGWNTLWIRSVGQDDLRQVGRAIMARVLVESPSRFLVSTLGDLRIGSGAVIDADILGRDIYFEVNETLDSPQKDIQMDGDVFYIHSLNNEGNPAVHLNGQTYQSPSITFAGVDMNHYRELATALAARGEAVFADGDLTVDLDRIEDLSPNPQAEFTPKLIFAEGSVSVSGTYHYSLLIVAGNNVYLTGDVQSDTSVSRTPQLGLFAKNDLIIPSDVSTHNGDLAIEAFVMADGDGNAALGNFRAESEKFSLGTLNFTGSIAVRGKGRSGVDMNAFVNRVYNFNPELNQRRDIPFSPFIVNTISWKEVPLSAPFPPQD